MAKQTGIRIGIDGVNRTSKAMNAATQSVEKGANRIRAAFNKSVGRSQMQATNMRFRAMGATAVAQGHLIAMAVQRIGRAAVGAASELGALTDRAADMSVTNVYAQQLSRALVQIGIKGADLDNLANAFLRMSRITGEVGEEGFMRVMSGIAEMNTEQERATELQRIFGRSGMQFAPLVRKGPEEFKRSLQGVIDVMPAVSDAAAIAGDSMADAYAIAGDSIKVGFQEMIGQMVLAAETSFGMSFPAIVMRAVAIVKATFQSGGAALALIFHNIVESAKWAWGWIEYGAKKAANAVANEWRKHVSGKELVEFDAKPPDFDFQSWADFGGAKAVEDYEEAMKRIYKYEESMKGGKHRGGIVEGAEDAADVLTGAAKKISDAFKDAKFVDASSYEAIKMVRQLSGTLGVAASSVFRATPANRGRIHTQTPAGSAADKTSQVIELVSQLLTVERDGWRSLSNMGVV